MNELQPSVKSAPIRIDGETLYLEQACRGQKSAAEKFKREFFESGETVINGSALFDQMEFDQWLEVVERNFHPETVADDWVPATTFFGIRKTDQKIIGMIDVRHNLDVKFLKEYGGHIGYAILPSERRKGYAAEMLQLALDYCRSLELKRVMLGCYPDNLGSIRTIEKCGGVHTDTKPYLDGNEIYLYWIAI